MKTSKIVVEGPNAEEVLDPVPPDQMAADEPKEAQDGSQVRGIIDSIGELSQEQVAEFLGELADMFDWGGDPRSHSALTGQHLKQAHQSFAQHLSQEAGS